MYLIYNLSISVLFNISCVPEMTIINLLVFNIPGYSQVEYNLFKNVKCPSRKGNLWKESKKMSRVVLHFSMVTAVFCLCSFSFPFLTLFFFSGSFSSSLPDISQCHSLNLALNHWNHCWSLSQTAPEARKSKIWRTHPGSVTLDTSAQAPVHSEQYFIYIKTQS